MPAVKQADVANSILRKLPAGDFAALRGHLKRVTTLAGSLLHGASEPARSIYFIESGIISLLAPLEHGKRIEIGHVGREGVAGVQAALGARTLTVDIMVQSAGVVFRSDAAAVRGLIKRSSALRELLTGYANVLHAQVAQTAACNGAHEVARRLARWLLMVRDRSDSDTMNLTHEIMALMLGVTRPGVTIAASSLKKSGLILYTRGRLKIVDRKGLERAACECYPIVSAYYRSELG